MSGISNEVIQLAGAYNDLRRFVLEGGRVLESKIRDQGPFVYEGSEDGLFDRLGVASQTEPYIDSDLAGETREFTKIPSLTDGYQPLSEWKRRNGKALATTTA